MSERPNAIRRLHSLSTTREEFVGHLRRKGAKEMGLLEIRAATELLRSYPEALEPLHIRLLSSYTTELLRPYFEFHGLLHGYDVELGATPIGQIVQELRRENNAGLSGADYVGLLLRWRDLHPEMANPLHAVGEEGRETIRTELLTHLAELLDAACERTDGSVILSLLPRRRPIGLGLYDSSARLSEEEFQMRLTRSVAELLRDEYPSCHLDDGVFLVRSLGHEGAFDSRLWQTSQYPFTVRGANLHVHRLLRFPVLERQPKVKCIVLDADNTLWGGVIGEDGMAGIALDATYPGSCFVEFQSRLLDFVHRGCLLALLSKNNHDDVAEVLRDHPHMVLREENFAALEVNWDAKPEGIVRIADELRLGLDSFLFVDDSPQECRMMRQMRPEVRVLQLPEKPIEIPTALDHLQELEILSFTAEDQDRSRMYVDNRRRRESAVSCRSVEEYLESLKMEMGIWIDDPAHQARVAQLTQKTNQFNLTTKRYTEADIESFLRDEDHLVACFSLRDVFGDNGVVGVALCRGLSTPSVEIDTFLLSCRVLGRRAEEAFLHHLLGALRDRECSEVTASYSPTRKNVQVSDFWLRQGFEETGGNRYRLLLGDLPSDHDSTQYISVREVEKGS